MFAGTDQLGLFIVAGLLLNLTPGPDVLYIVRSGVRGGKRAGAVAALGIGAGCCVHIVAAAVGLGALIAASVTAFTVLKWIGAAYLVYMGLGMLLSRGDDAAGGLAGAASAQSRATSEMAPMLTPTATPTDTPTDTPTPTSAAAPTPALTSMFASAPASTPNMRSVFAKAFWTNVLNPKVALFFLAFVPQFIAPDAAHKTAAFLLLGLIFNLDALPVNLAWGLGAAWLAQRLQRLRTALVWLDRAAGALFVYFGIRLAAAEPIAFST